MSLRKCGHLAGLVVDDEVEIAVADPRLGIGEPGVLLRQRPQALRRDRPALRHDRQFAALGRDDLARHADVVAEVDVALPGRERLLTDARERDHHLDLGGPVPKGGEAELAADARQHDPARDSDPLPRHGVGFQLGVFRPDLTNSVRARVSHRVRFDAVLTEPRHLLQADTHLLRDALVDLVTHGIKDRRERARLRRGNGTILRRRSADVPDAVMSAADCFLNSARSHSSCSSSARLPPIRRDSLVAWVCSRRAWAAAAFTPGRWFRQADGSTTVPREHRGRAAFVDPGAGTRPIWRVMADTDRHRMRRPRHGVQPTVPTIGVWNPSSPRPTWRAPPMAARRCSTSAGSWAARRAAPSTRRGTSPARAIVDLDTELAGPPGPGGRHPLPDPEVFGAAMRRAGVAPGPARRRVRRRTGLGRGPRLVAAALGGARARPGARRRARRLDGGGAAAQHRGRPAPAEGDFVPRARGAAAARRGRRGGAGPRAGCCWTRARRSATGARSSRSTRSAGTSRARSAPRPRRTWPPTAASCPPTGWPPGSRRWAPTAGAEVGVYCGSGVSGRAPGAGAGGRGHPARPCTSAPGASGPPTRPARWPRAPSAG